MLFKLLSTPLSALSNPLASPSNSIVIPLTLFDLNPPPYKLSISSCVATIGYSYSSFFISTNMSFTIPMLRSSKSEMEIPHWTHRSMNNAVLTSLSISLSFFLLWTFACFPIPTFPKYPEESHKY